LTTVDSHPGTPKLEPFRLQARAYLDSRLGAAEAITRKQLKNVFLVVSMVDPEMDQAKRWKT
jgi:hypothetical protein